MKKYILSNVIWLILFVSCQKVSLTRIEKKSGKWELILQTKKIGCVSNNLEYEQLDTIELDFISDTKVIKTQHGTSLELYWEIEKINSANPTNALITLTSTAGYTYKKFFVMKATKNEELWEWDGGCFPLNYKDVYKGVLKKK